MSEEKKNKLILYIPFVAILIFLAVLIYSDYIYLPQARSMFLPEAFISFLPLVIFLIIFIIIEWKSKTITKGRET